MVEKLAISNGSLLLVGIASDKTTSSNTLNRIVSGLVSINPRERGKDDAHILHIALENPNISRATLKSAKVAENQYEQKDSVACRIIEIRLKAIEDAGKLQRQTLPDGLATC